MKKVITFAREAKLDLLASFNKMVDAEGFVVEKDNPTQRILALDGEPLKVENFAGIRKGSLIFIKSDINSLIEIADILV